ncbi:hypothetical protein X975_26751, partial [Stegodyphus mimosarum]
MKKLQAYTRKTRIIEELKAAIGGEITADLTRKVMQNFTQRLQKCTQHDGHHLDDVIFKT